MLAFGIFLGGICLLPYPAGREKSLGGSPFTRDRKRRRPGFARWSIASRILDCLALKGGAVYIEARRFYYIELGAAEAAAAMPRDNNCAEHAHKNWFDDKGGAIASRLLGPSRKRLVRHQRREPDQVCAASPAVDV